MLLNCTDCEPTMCKMGRIVKADLGHDWQGCTDHRLEKTADAFYKHKGVLARAAKAKEIVTLIHTSSQVLIPVRCCVGALMFVISSVGSSFFVWVWGICVRVGYACCELVSCQGDADSRTELGSSKPN